MRAVLGNLLLVDLISDQVIISALIHGDVYLMVPEPTSAALFALGLVAFVGIGYRRFRRM